jgi:hypothetical protein
MYCTEYKYYALSNNFAQINRKGGKVQVFFKLSNLLFWPILLDTFYFSSVNYNFLTTGKTIMITFNCKMRSWDFGISDEINMVKPTMMKSRHI